VNCGFGGIVSGLTREKVSGSDFLRFLLDLSRAIELEFGSDGSGNGGIFLSGDGTAAAATGGEFGGIEEGGEIDVMSSDVTSTDGDLARISPEECELGEGESSGGAGGGGRWK
jgi:hypothetical protein